MVVLERKMDIFCEQRPDEVLERKMDIFCEQRPDDGGTGKEDGYIL